jgi:hypothetical protein
VNVTGSTISVINHAPVTPIVPELADHLERFADPRPNGLVFIGPKGGRLRRSNFRKL